MKPAPFLSRVLDDDGKFALVWRQWLTSVSSFFTANSPIGVIGVRNDDTSASVTQTACFASPIKLKEEFFSPTKILTIQSWFGLDSTPLTAIFSEYEILLDGTQIAIARAEGVSANTIGGAKLDCVIKVTATGTSTPVYVAGGITSYGTGSDTYSYTIWQTSWPNIDTTQPHEIMVKMIGDGNTTVTHASTVATSYMEQS